MMRVRVGRCACAIGGCANSQEMNEKRCLLWRWCGSHLLRNSKFQVQGSQNLRLRNSYYCQRRTDDSQGLGPYASFNTTTSLRHLWGVPQAGLILTIDGWHDGDRHLSLTAQSRLNSGQPTFYHTIMPSLACPTPITSTRLKALVLRVH
jgi:hypothetical protein